MKHITIVDSLFIRAINWAKPEIKIPFQVERDSTFRSFITALNNCYDHPITPELYVRAIVFGDHITPEDIKESVAEANTPRIVPTIEASSISDTLIVGIDEED